MKIFMLFFIIICMLLLIAYAADKLRLGANRTSSVPFVPTPEQLYGYYPLYQKCGTFVANVISDMWNEVGLSRPGKHRLYLLDPHIGIRYSPQYGVYFTYVFRRRIDSPLDAPRVYSKDSCLSMARKLNEQFEGHYHLYSVPRMQIINAKNLRDGRVRFDVAAI